MIRAILGIIAGYAAWTALWLGGNGVFFGEASSVGSVLHHSCHNSTAVGAFYPPGTRARLAGGPGRT